MANENFGLGFTVHQPAVFSEHDKGNIGPMATVFAELPAFHNISPMSTLFADVVALHGIGPMATADATGICLAPSILETPGSSTLTAEGGGPTNDLSCP